MPDIGIHPAYQGGLPGDVEIDTRIGLLLTNTLHLVKNRTVIQFPLVEGRLDQRRLHIGGNQQAVNPGVGLDVLTHLRQLAVTPTGLQAIEIGSGIHIPGLCQPHFAYRAVGDAGHGIVVDTRQLIYLLGDSIDALDDIVSEQVALLHLDRHDDIVGAAKTVTNLVV